MVDDLYSQTEYVPEKKKSSPALIIVIVVISIVAVVVVGGIILAGVVFLWASSFTEDAGDEISTINVDTEIDAEMDVLEITVISGTVDWTDYQIIVDQTITLTPESMGPTSAGMTMKFSNPLWDPDYGSMYEIRIVEISENRIVHEDIVTGK